MDCVSLYERCCFVFLGIGVVKCFVYPCFTDTGLVFTFIDFFCFSLKKLKRHQSSRINLFMFLFCSFVASLCFVGLNPNHAYCKSPRLCVLCFRVSNYRPLCNNLSIWPFIYSFKTSNDNFFSSLLQKAIKSIRYCSISTHLLFSSLHWYTDCSRLARLSAINIRYCLFSSNFFFIIHFHLFVVSLRTISIGYSFFHSSFVLLFITAICSKYHDIFENILFGVDISFIPLYLTA